MYLKDAHDKELLDYTKQKDARTFDQNDKLLELRKADYELRKADYGSQADYRLADLNMKGAQLQQQAQAKQQELEHEDCSKHPNVYQCIQARASASHLDPNAVNEWFLNHVGRIVPALREFNSGVYGTPNYQQPAGGYNPPVATGLGALSNYNGNEPLDFSLWGKK
jgi:hypothetical protein